MRKELGERQGWRCVYRHRDISKRASVDHIVPIHQGGTSDPGNLQLTCLRCNQSKGALSDAEYRVKLANIQAALAYREARAQSMGWSSYEAHQGSMDCPCHSYGCPQGCPGCEMCEHPEGHPDRVICPWASSVSRPATNPGAGQAASSVRRWRHDDPRRNGRIQQPRPDAGAGRPVASGKPSRSATDGTAASGAHPERRPAGLGALPGVLPDHHTQSQHPVSLLDRRSTFLRLVRGP